MRILVTGSRGWTNAGELGQKRVKIMRNKLMEYHSPDTVVVEGGAGGADFMASMLALGNGMDYEEHKADWKHCNGERCTPEHRRSNAWGDYCPTAGHDRNQRMVDLGADLCLAFLVRTAKNAGTRDCIRRARLAGIEVVEVWDDGD